MKREMDLIRAILLSFEETEGARVATKAIDIGGYTSEQVSFHLELMKEADLLEHSISRPQTRNGYQFAISFDHGIRPTMKGYDLLDSIRDPKTWARTKKAAEGAGGFTVDLLKELATGLIKKQIEDRTGVKL